MQKILYVEDDMDIAEAIRMILKKEGFEIDVANNGKQCFEKIKDTEFDLFLLDVMLPDMSGWDIFEKIKNKNKAKYAFLSAIPISNERKSHLKEEGIQDYITKPFQKADLIKRVKAILGE